MEEEIAIAVDRPRIQRWTLLSSISNYAILTIGFSSGEDKVKLQL